MPSKKGKKSRATGGSHIKVTAANKIRILEKLLANLKDKPSAQNAITTLRERLDHWRSKLKV